MAEIDPGQERKLREEEAKLSAAWLNGGSLALIVVGVLQPVMAQALAAAVVDGLSGATFGCAGRATAHVPAGA